MTALLVVLGLLLVAVALVDLAWTTVAAGSGAGPVTGRLAGGLWAAAIALHQRRESHTMLVAAGVGIVFAVLAAWIVAVLAGWTLVFLAADAAVEETGTGRNAGVIDRLYFTGYTVFTLGIGDFRPGRGPWQLATAVATGTGLILVSLAITYLVPVASAVAQRRQLASYISALGDDPEDILRRAWAGDGFGSLSQHLVTLTPLVDGARQRHLTYPVLHYFHSPDEMNAAPQQIVHLALALEAMRAGVDPAVRPDRAALEPLNRAIGSFLDTLESAYIHEEDALPPLELDGLRRDGIPTVADDEYQAAVAHEEAVRRRRLLAGLLLDDGWGIEAAEEGQSAQGET